MLELLVAAATPTRGSLTGTGASTVGLEGGIETSADICWVVVWAAPQSPLSLLLL